ncbi:hypothetical protein Ae201684P_002826 [Aphanomyces euteiches]|nr:hypothetical protein Ae201684P_002826 [Aphanomyces euteiches]
MMPTQQMKMNMLKRTLDYEADKENIPMFSTVTKDQFGLTEKRLIHDKLAGPSPYNAVKSNWTIEDEVKMKALVHEYGTKNWNEIALHFTNKSGRQCHERWKQMCESAVTPKKIGMTSGSFNFTKALAAMRKNLANNSSIKSTPPSIHKSKISAMRKAMSQIPRWIYLTSEKLIPCVNSMESEQTKLSIGPSSDDHLLHPRDTCHVEFCQAQSAKG